VAVKLIIGIVLFAGVHLFVMLAPGARNAVKVRIGEGPFKGLFSLVSLVGLGLMIWGFAGSRSGPQAADWLYFPADWARHVTMLLVLIGFISVASSHGKGYIRLWLKQPMSIGIALWSGGHLLANGKRADVYLFGTFFVLAVLDIVLSTLRGKVPAYVPRIRSDVIAVVAGVVLYAIFLLWFHPYVLNLPIIQ
jgi:uncharacterized membrane protein